MASPNKAMGWILLCVGAALFWVARLFGQLVFDDPDHGVVIAVWICGTIVALLGIGVIFGQLNSKVPGESKQNNPEDN